MFDDGRSMAGKTLQIVPSKVPSHRAMSAGWEIISHQTFNLPYHHCILVCLDLSWAEWQPPTFPRKMLNEAATWKESSVGEVDFQSDPHASQESVAAVLGFLVADSSSENDSYTVGCG